MFCLATTKECLTLPSLNLIKVMGDTQNLISFIIIANLQRDIINKKHATV